MSRAEIGAALLAGLLAWPATAGVPAGESYQLHCSGCHGSDGSGDGRVVPSLREIGPLVRAEGGRDYLVRVPGVSQAPIASADLAALLNFVLTEMAGARDFEAFTEAEIEARRARPLRDPLSARPVPREPRRQPEDPRPPASLEAKEES